MMCKGDQISGGVFLVGLGVLFLTGWWWPGILLLLGLTALAKGACGSDWGARWGGLWLIGLALLFMVGFRWELVLIGMGVMMLLGYRRHNAGWHRWHDDDEQESKPKRKNDDKHRHDDEYGVEYL
jgi:hypothetical protein